MREYVVGADNVTLLSGPQTLVFINPDPTRSLKIRRIWIGYSHDATPAMQRAQLVTQQAPFPTLVASSPAKINQKDDPSLIVAATSGAAGTAGITASSEGAGAKSVILSEVFNTSAGWRWDPGDDLAIVMQAGGGLGFGLYFPAPPATLQGWSFGVLYREMP
jgi:hypothetical protein